MNISPKKKDEDKDLYTIFGRDIILEDILKVLNSPQKKKKELGYGFFNGFLCFVREKKSFKKSLKIDGEEVTVSHRDHYEMNISELVRWEYGKSYYAQNKEVHDFVASVLFSGKK